MRHCLLALFILLLACDRGALQLVAWAGMFVDYAQAQDFGSALEQTFAAESRCAMCCAIEKLDEDPAAPEPAERIPVFVAVPAAPAIVQLGAGMAPASTVPDIVWRPQGHRQAPPVPPPQSYRM